MNPTTAGRRMLTLSIDGGPPLLVIREHFEGPEIDYVRSYTAVMPDPAWVAVDSYGHEHRWAATRREDGGKPVALPSLNRTFRHVECDGTGNHSEAFCEGWDEPVWHCVLCGDEVIPGYKPDYLARTTGIPVRVGPVTGMFVVEGDGLMSNHNQTPAVLSDGTRSMTARATLHEIEWASHRPPRQTIHLVFDDTIEI